MPDVAGRMLFGGYQCLACHMSTLELQHGLVAYLAIWAAATAYLAFKGADWTLPAIFAWRLRRRACPTLGMALTRRGPYLRLSW